MELPQSESSIELQFTDTEHCLSPLVSVLQSVQDSLTLLATETLSLQGVCSLVRLGNFIIPLRRSSDSDVSVTESLFLGAIAFLVFREGGVLSKSERESRGTTLADGLVEHSTIRCH